MTRNNDMFHPSTWYHSTSGAKNRCSRQGFDKTPAFLVLDLVQLLKWTMPSSHIVKDNHLGGAVDFLASFVFLCSPGTSFKNNWRFGKASVLPLAPACQRSWWWPEPELVLKVVDPHLTISLFHRLPPLMTNQNKNIQTWHNSVVGHGAHFSLTFITSSLDSSKRKITTWDARPVADAAYCVQERAVSAPASGHFPQKCSQPCFPRKKHWPL